MNAERVRLGVARTARSLAVPLMLCLLGRSVAAFAADSEQAARLADETLRLYEAGDYRAAVEAGRRALDLVGNRAEDDGATIGVLETLALALAGLGENGEAVPAARRALAARERTAGAEHPSTIRSLCVLAEVHASAGEFAAALPAAERAAAAAETTLDADHPLTARALNSLAEVQRGRGDLAAARRLAERGLEIRRRTLAEDHPDLAVSLNEVALVHATLRDFAAAVPLYERALAIREARLGARHPFTAETLNNLAAAYWALRRFSQARPLLERAVEIRTEAFGENNPRTALALGNLAELYRSLGEEERAASLAERVVRIYERTLGEDHPKTAAALTNAAGFAWRSGRYDEARPRLERAAAIWEKRLGPEHPDTAAALNRLATFFQSSGDDRRALAFYRRSLAAEDRVIANVLSLAAEEDKLRFLERTQGHYVAALSLIQREFHDDPDAVRFALELVLRRKGVVLDAQSRSHEALAAALDGEALAAWRRLALLRGELAALLLRQDDGDVRERRASAERLQSAIAREEEALRRMSPLAAEENRQRRISADALAGRLPEGSALIEFVAIRDWDARRVEWAPTSRYLAFVLAADGRVSLADLGGAAALDERVRSTLASIGDYALKDYVQITDAALADLHAAVLAPLKEVAGVRRLFISPDGELSKLPFSALRLPSGRYLTEETVLSYVASGGDLMRPKSSLKARAAMVLAANPDFDGRPPPSSRRAVERAVRPLGLRDLRFAPLPGTAGEAEMIPRHVGGEVKILQGEDASESALREAGSARILHLATHGFFLESIGAEAAIPFGRPATGGLRDGAGPMIGSGLALAGANRAGTIETGDDGILTALEVSGMNLHATELVVLSACETGLGQPAIGQGVFGLRRAFVLAGAQSLVMSLWRVNDQFTRDLMVRFYRSYGGGRSPAEALRDAELQTIAELRERIGAAPVNLWAPFIVQQTGIHDGP